MRVFTPLMNHGMRWRCRESFIWVASCSLQLSSLLPRSPLNTVLPICGNAFTAPHHHHSSAKHFLNPATTAPLLLILNSFKFLYSNAPPAPPGGPPVHTELLLLPLSVFMLLLLPLVLNFFTLSPCLGNFTQAG